MKQGKEGRGCTSLGTGVLWKPCAELGAGSHSGFVGLLWHPCCWFSSSGLCLLCRRTLQLISCR